MLSATVQRVNGAGGRFVQFDTTKGVSFAGQRRSGLVWDVWKKDRVSLSQYKAGLSREAAIKVAESAATLTQQGFNV
jgi:hypothetical protein